MFWNIDTEVGAIYEVYIDVLAANNFFADLAALLAVNIFRKRSVRASYYIRRIHRNTRELSDFCGVRQSGFLSFDGTLSYKSCRFVIYF